jgi:MYXO-CTERM domain-containing protein
MSIVNRRNAVLGWATWEAAKRYAKFKARRGASGGEDGRSNKLTIAAAGAAALAGSVLWRKRKRTAAAEGEGEAGGGGGGDAE